MPKHLESAIQNKIITRLEMAGWYVIKITICNKPGSPDLLAVKDGRYVWIEVKSEKGEISALQGFRHRELRAADCEVIVAKSLDQIAHLL